MDTEHVTEVELRHGKGSDQDIQPDEQPELAMDTLAEDNMVDAVTQQECIEQQDRAVEEEEDSSGEGETDEEDERRQFGIYQCLPVDDREPDFESGEPTSAEEYLRRVRWEASKLPRVVTSSVNPRNYDQCRTDYASAAGEVPDCPQQMQPSTAWLRDFLARFALLRRQLRREYEAESGQVSGLPLRVAYRLPSPAHPGPMHTAPYESSASFGDEAADPDRGDPFSPPSPSSLMPELLHLKGLDQVQLVQRAGAHLRRVTRGEGLTPQDAAWLYAYSARIEQPLHADTCALYRALLRHCARLRARSSDPRDPLLPHLNILIAISGAYFRQDAGLASVWGEEEE